MAIEDGLVLARALSDFDDVEVALQRYESARIERTTKIVNKSAENLGRFHNEALLDPDTADAYVDREWAPEKIRERYEWILSYDAVTATI